jgi:hypothetical protein
MGFPPNKNTKKQVAQNSQSLQRISDRFNPVFQRISDAAQSSREGANSPGLISRATCTENAPGDNTIAANLINADGTEGDAVSVFCNISNGSALDEAVPRLEDNDEIFVTQSVFDNAGTPVFRWYCVTNFQASEDCTCEQPDAVFNSVTIASDENITFNGVGGDSYITYNSSAGEMELWTDGVKVTSWKP